MRLDIDELLAFCNRVRAAGGAKQLDALLPGDRGNPDSCLIARNLNFACSVTPMPNATHLWRMHSSDPRLELVAKALDIEIRRDRTPPYIILPPDVGDSAQSFDAFCYPPELYIDNSNHPAVHHPGDYET